MSRELGSRCGCVEKERKDFIRERDLSKSGVAFRRRVFIYSVYLLVCIFKQLMRLNILLDD